MVTISGGKVVAVTPGRSPKDDSIHAYAITAGLIDASARITTGLQCVEQGREVEPDRRVADSLDPFDPRWRRLARSGITTAFIAPDSFDVVGGLGVVLKTAGGLSIAERTLRADAALCGAIGGRPSVFNSPAGGPPQNFFARRPTTRMGVEWEWRKAMYDAEASTRIPERAFRGSDVLVKALAGELPLFIEAWATQDIRTAVFLVEEAKREGLGNLRLIVDGAAEGWKEPDLLARVGAAVVLAPFSEDGRTGPDRAFMAWDVARELRDRGLLVALSSHGNANLDDRLDMQAAKAMRAGFSFDEALAAVTLHPAQILGVEDRVGSLAPGLDGDLVLWSGPPFEPTSSVIGVVLDGRLLLDPRAQ
jgi:imidazolonepropionase-like amidohydrolase